jgi:CheY-like chemotaxis protein
MTELLELVAKEPFDLILVYCHMYGEELELFAGLRAQYGKPIIAMSGLRDPERDVRVKAAGIMLLPCPFSFEEFTKALDACLPLGRTTPSAGKSVINSRKTKPLRVVMLDDEPGVLEAYKLMVSVLVPNSVILTFNDGASALRELEKEEPALFTMDWNRPGALNGAGLMQILASKGAKYPIVVISASAEWVAKERLNGFISQGLNVSVLSKPITLEDLRTLSQLVDAEFPNSKELG